MAKHPPPTNCLDSAGRPGRKRRPAPGPDSGRSRSPSTPPAKGRSRPSWQSILHRRTAWTRPAVPAAAARVSHTWPTARLCRPAVVANLAGALAGDPRSDPSSWYTPRGPRGGRPGQPYLAYRPALPPGRGCQPCRRPTSTVVVAGRPPAQSRPADAGQHQARFLLPTGGGRICLRPTPATQVYLDGSRSWTTAGPIAASGRRPAPGTFFTTHWRRAHPFPPAPPPRRCRLGRRPHRFRRSRRCRRYRRAPPLPGVPSLPAHPFPPAPPPRRCRLGRRPHRFRRSRRCRRYRRDDQVSIGRGRRVRGRTRGAGGGLAEAYGRDRPAVAHIGAQTSCPTTKSASAEAEEFAAERVAQVAGWLRPMEEIGQRADAFSSSANSASGSGGAGERHPCFSS